MNTEKVLNVFLDRAKALVRQARSMEVRDDERIKERSERVSDLRKATRHIEMALKLSASWCADAQEPVTTKPARPPGRTGADSFTGDTSTIPLSKLISFLGMQGKTGVLTIMTSDETMTIVCEEGHLVHATSDRTPEGSRLGEVLVSMKCIEATALEHFLEEYDNKRERLGEALLRDGLVTDDDLREALVTQVQQLFHRVMSHDSAKFAFAEGVPSGTGARIRVHVDHLLLESARHTDERAPA